MKEMKTAIITGAAKGIGRSIALKLADAGFALVLNDMKWDAESESVFSDRNCDYVLSSGDVSSSEYVKSLMDTAMEKYGSIDVVVNNAGITRDGLIIKMSEEDFDKVIEVNLKGVFNVMKASARIMMKQRIGRIINISSIVGLRGNAGQINYAAAKGGVIAMTKSLAKELASRSVLVNAIAPGFIKTDMTDVLPENVVESLLTQIPLGKLGEVEDVANLALFLASEESGYITGQIISVDGGMNI
ncbi:3-oxoacyl-[acyl-carrier-protein] reductase [Microaceticoccus formicicus]|uniref:3-oxoacyl-[acyl-carrier-protein] reductase n=1 Tax=Microaceticoccus formicicus TaxID=3118105 RepID=UPI003CD04BA2|nr:3-oxoacyl-[acyl-carrier-protein] reductase [Peptoniphilaceae bacterium AMB_02]